MNTTLSITHVFSVSFRYNRRRENGMEVRINDAPRANEKGRRRAKVEIHFRISDDN
jgi:hypothetical protein